MGFFAAAGFGLMLACPTVLASEEANRLGMQGIRLIQEGKPEKGFALLRQATLLEPDDALWRLRLGSLLMQYAQGLTGMSDGLQSELLMNDAEMEIRQALDLLPPQAKQLRGEGYYLLGQIYSAGYGFREAARPYFQRAVEENPTHAGAKQALTRLDQISASLP